jgi:hypothetical protein
MPVTLASGACTAEVMPVIASIGAAMKGSNNPIAPPHGTASAQNPMVAMIDARVFFSVSNGARFSWRPTWSCRSRCRPIP